MGGTNWRVFAYRFVSNPCAILGILPFYGPNMLFAFLGAGKTFTMLGTDREPGIMARTLNDLFYEMDKTKEDVKYKVSMSYLEVSKQS